MVSIITVGLDIHIEASPEVTAQLVERLREWVREYGYMATDYVIDSALAGLGHVEFEAWHDEGRVKAA